MLENMNKELTDVPPEAMFETSKKSGGQSKNALAEVTELALLTSKAKEKATCDYISLLIQTDVRFLLFAHHQQTLDYLEQELQRLKTRYIRIDGKVPMSKRNARVEEFQTDSAVQVALLSITACGQGLNLQSSSTVVFAELYWVPGQVLQAEDRVHRVGQTAAVNIHYLLAPGTLDDVMYETVNRKHRDTTATLDGVRRALDVEKVTGTSSIPPPNAKRQKTFIDTVHDLAAEAESEAKIEAEAELSRDGPSGSSVSSRLAPPGPSENAMGANVKHDLPTVVTNSSGSSSSSSTTKRELQTMAELENSVFVTALELENGMEKAREAETKAEKVLTEANPDLAAEAENDPDLAAALAASLKT
eukprot:gnl/MRDRNA2_/MRDRNA2_53511_c0_seq2.p1 gnl/MRDRNA2_/MRDRNA2_53511_c0~~gnl/MRDRNA2_/MRDRNA2_53511_c0_seq2.p1  ORF type:complete len:361 (+),score=88.99 gnl/MRDRNA2_/MRDRNA2_53511_c0_seq2:62-1144(+)